ncbi:YitT family protein [Clostridium tyrobutyricum]|uniref:YitT family protein n=1 Tax=Clostridium tyrobutyricum TaxID=1519 RepID=UPI00189F8C16|nr:YitT family protein [Clostridium tyrobutyricum]
MLKSFIIKKNIIYYYIIQYLQVIIGCILIALAFNLFLKPNNIASGGIVGLSLLINRLFGIEPAVVQWCANIPLFLIGLIILGKRFTVNTILGSLILPLFILLTSDLKAITLNPFLGCIYGGIISGIGLGLVFKGHASTGGTSIIAKIVNKYTPLSIGNCQGIIDGFVVIASAYVFDIEKALYAIITLFITSKSIDMIQLGFSGSKVAFVISDKSEIIKDTILKNLDRGITKLSGFGGYTDRKLTVLVVVMDQSEVNKFKDLVKNIDPGAFIIISDTHEVLGQGFNLSRNPKNY